MEVLLFVFFLLVLIGMLAGGYVVRYIKKLHKNAQEAADKKEQRFREETGRQRQQYSQRAQPRQPQSQQPQQAQESQSSYTSQGSNSSQEPTQKPQEPTQEQGNARRTETATGETIIDHHHEKRENQKIFDDSDGEYVEFEEA